MKDRIFSLDAARGIAVILAMLSHCFVQFGPDNPVPALTRLATPTFIVLLGAMLEIVYLRRLRAGADPRLMRRRLAERAILCYVLFGLITLAAFVTGKIGSVEALKAVTYTDNGRFGTILKLYAVMFLGIVLILPLYRRFGGYVLAAVALAAWVVKGALAASDLPGFYLPDFLIGYAEGGFGPSILPSFVFVTFGFWIGGMLAGRTSRLLPGLVLGLALLGLWIALPSLTVSGIGDLVTWQKRSGDHPDYYAFGIAGSAFMIWVCSFLVRIPALSRGLCFLGRQTLFVYGFGNVMLNLLPVYRGDNVAVSLGLIVAFLAVLGLTCPLPVPHS